MKTTPLSGPSVDESPCLPVDLDLERSILGQMLWHGQAVKTYRGAGLTLSVFFRKAHQDVCAAIFAVADRGCVPDLPLVGLELRQRKQLDDVGVAYFSSLTEYGTPRTNEANIRECVRQLQALARPWQIVQFLKTTEREIYSNPAAALNGGTERIRARFDAIIASPTPTAARFRTAADRLDDRGQDIPWVAPPYMVAGCVTDLTAHPKTGKTTLLLHLAGCLTHGRRFLDQATVQSSVLLLSEQSWASLQPAVRRAGLEGDPDLHILTRWDVPELSWPTTVQTAVDHALKVGAKLIIVDTFGPWAGLEGDSENDAGAVLAALEPVQAAAAKHALAFLLSRHDRKSGGSVGLSGRGSSAFAGAADIVMRYRRPDGKGRATQRVIDALSRFSETPDSQIVERIVSASPMEGGLAETFVSLGDARAVARQEARDLLLTELLPRSEADAVTLQELVESSLERLARSTAQTVLKELSTAEDGQVKRIGSGKKNDAFRYFRTEEG